MSDQTEPLQPGNSIAVHQIDLSLPPRDRYVALAKLHAPQIERLTGLFDALLEDLGIPYQRRFWIKHAARLLLRRLHSHEETEEIRGIAKATGVSMYLLVSFNVLLDLLMGCTSGAVRSLEPGQPPSHARMLHFRTLDWGMDPLRSVIVQLDFIKSKSTTGRKVLASSITYVGFVGVLTGVRKDLSMSLNFRGVHNATTRAGDFRFYLHHLLVLLGMRQSISSLLRSCLLENLAVQGPGPSTLATLAGAIPPKPSTAAYLIFSDGQTTLTMEKDHRTALLSQSKSFIVMTNHDLNQSTDTNRNDDSATSELASLADVLSESTHRRNCITEKWRSKVRKAERRLKRQAHTSQELAEATEAWTDQASLGWRTTRSGLVKGERKLKPRNTEAGFENQTMEDTVTITRDEVISWVAAWPTTNECTHFTAVLDPTKGEVMWTQRYLTSVDEP